MGRITVLSTSASALAALLLLSISLSARDLWVNNVAGNDAVADGSKE